MDQAGPLIKPGVPIPQAFWMALGLTYFPFNIVDKSCHLNVWKLSICMTIHKVLAICLKLKLKFFLLIDGQALALNIS